MSSHNNSSNGQENLFQSQQNDKAQPLAHRARPLELSDFQGQKAIFKKHPFLARKDFPSLILWGPPGSGKTTLAHVLAHNSEKDIYPFNAVLGGVADLKKLIAKAAENEKFFGKKAIIFVDEIHRFNKAQQDALLPYVEQGEIKFIGATTESPKSSVNAALLSRVHLIRLNPLSQEDLKIILHNVAKKEEVMIQDDVIELIATYGDGDARAAINILEGLIISPGENDKENLKTVLGESLRKYDKNNDRHYDVISAFIKSMRGSDPDAALLYLAIMLDGGEDPKFIARRLVVFASEDIGNADPSALTLAVSGLHAVQNIGMPEARINLAQVTTYMASTVKSNAAYKGINQALEYVRNNPTIEVPTHLRNHHPDIKNYQYPHDFPNHYVPQRYAPTETPSFYQPTDQGTEAKIKERLGQLKKR